MSAPKIQLLPLRRALPAGCPRDGSGEPRSSSDSPPDNAPKGKKSRTSKPKVRTGCQTCKIRRVKCDEQKPDCDRCTSTGRKCDGYVLVPRKKRAVPSVDKNPSFIPDIGPDELRAIDFFHVVTAPALASYFDAEFWTRLVVQMSYVEPTIRHAIVALGSLHEQRETGVKMLPLMGHNFEAEPLGVSMPVAKKRPDENPLAISQYNKAITHLSKRLRSESSVEIALLACVLFVCVEFLRGDPNPAVNHFKSGMSIAMTSISNLPRVNNSTTHRIREQILPFFNRIEMLSTLFGNETIWPYPVPLQATVPQRFETMREARDSIVHIANHSLRFIRWMKYRKYDRVVLPDDITRQSDLIRQLEVWKATLDDMLLSDHITERDVDAAKTLRIHHIICLIWMRRSTMAEECANDLSMADFETAVNLAESIQSVAGTRGQRSALNSSTFLFDMEIVSPIYFIGVKCRHPLLRRRAIKLLSSTWRREGLWDSHMAAAIARRCMELEERNLTKLDGSELPAEHDRVYNIHITSEVGMDPKHHHVTIYMKPGGMEGEWQVWNELITLTSPAEVDVSWDPSPPVAHVIQASSMHVHQQGRSTREVTAQRPTSSDGC